MGMLRRRRLLQLAVASGMMAGLTTNCRPSVRPPTDARSPLDGTATNAGHTFDWQQFAGAEITLLLDDHPWTRGLLPYLPDFEALTGITVKTRIVAEPEYFAAMEAALRADPVRADVFFLPMDSTAYRLWRDDLLLPLTPLINNPALTAADYNLFDFPEGFRLAAMYPPNGSGSQLFGIPATFEAYILFYNRRLVDQFLADRVPQTMTELVQAANQINQSGQAIGAVMRGVKSDTIIDGVSGIMLNGWGIDPTPLPFNLWFDGDWQTPRLNDPRVIEGLTTYAQLMQAGPPDIKQMAWPEATQLFQAGQAAFYIDASLFGPDFENPETSAIAGQVGYTVLPQVYQHQQSLTGHWLWGLGIPRRSAQPEAAWLFVAWATSVEMEAKIAVTTGGAPRFSTWLTPSVYTEAMNLDYALTVQTAMQTSRPTAVLHPRWNQVALAIAATIHQIYDGADPAVAADQLQDTVMQLMAELEESQ